MATEYIVWIPANGEDPITFGLSGPYILVRRDGGLSGQSVPIQRQAPGQHGATLIDTEVTSRVQALSIVINGQNRDDFWEQRARLARALVSLPARPGETVTPGTLQIHRSILPVVEIPAIPHMSPVEGDRHPTWMHADIEFHCPYPYYRDVYDSSSELAAGETGLTFPLEHPWESLSGFASVDITNDGDVPAPVTIRVYGELTTPRIINQATNERIEVAGLIAAGEHLEIQTAFGEKSVELVHSGGARTNKMGDLNLDVSDFWHLAPGVNTITLNADNNVNGTATIIWRNRYAGV